MKTDHFEVLGIDRSATNEEIRRAYYRKVKQHPPEKDEEGFKRVRSAYEVLSDPKAREHYEEVRDKFFGLGPSGE